MSHDDTPKPPTNAPHLAPDSPAPGPDELAAIRAEGEARAAEEAAESPPKEDPKPQAITPTFVVDCCRARDKGMGILYVTLMRDKFVYVPEKKQWYAWTGNYWKDVFESRVRASVERVAEKLHEIRMVELGKFKDLDPEDKEGRKEAKEKLDLLRGRINSLHEPNGVSNCLKFALDNDTPMLVEAEHLDQIPGRLACRNGIVDMLTGTLYPGRLEDYVTRVCPVDWGDVDTRAPQFEAMVHEILGENEEITHFFHKLIGYAMSGMGGEKVFIILLGEEGDSGKTTIFETIYQLVKGYAAPMPVELLLEQGGAAQNPNAPTPVVMGMRGMRLTWASEPGENRRFSVDRIKLYSGADSLTGRNPWDVTNTTFDPTHTLFMLTNHKMRANAGDTAFWNRVRLIDCPFSFVPHPKAPNERKRITGLKEKIVAEEGPGVLAWIVRGYQLYVKEGLTPPDAVLEATARYRREEDDMAEFIEACIEKLDDREKYETMGDVYDVFRGWFLANCGRKVPTKVRFGKLSVRYLTKLKIGGDVRYYGIRIRAEAKSKYLKD